MAVHSRAYPGYLGYYNPDLCHDLRDYGDCASLLNVYGLHYFDVEFHYDYNTDSHLSESSGDIRHSNNVDGCCNLGKHSDIHYHKYV
jgi:hypothetical protein